MVCAEHGLGKKLTDNFSHKIAREAI